MVQKTNYRSHVNGLKCWTWKTSSKLVSVRRSKKIFFSGVQNAKMSTRTTDAFDFSDISHKQELRIENQVHSAFEKSGMRDGIGTSRKEDKLAHAGDSHQQAQGTSIHSWGTLHKVESVARTFCRFCCSRRVKFAKLRRSKNANSGRLKFANLSQSKRANHKISTAQIGCSGYG